MEIATYITLTRKEIQEKLPYAVICETKEGASWNTGRRKRKWNAEFTEEERKASEEIFRKAHTWYLVKGIPEEVRMKIKTFMLWQKLGNFCAEL